LRWALQHRRRPTPFAAPPAIRRSVGSCIRPNASGVCRRIGGSCGQLYSSQCLDDPKVGKASKNLPLATNNLCNQYCQNQRGECEPAACNRDADCALGEACARGWCQPATRPQPTTPATPPGLVRPLPPDAPRQQRPDLQPKKQP
jgi:hypothetical protein